MRWVDFNNSYNLLTWRRDQIQERFQSKTALLSLLCVLWIFKQTFLIQTQTGRKSLAYQMSSSKTRNNGWAAARSSLINATLRPLNLGPYFPCHLCSGHMCNSLLGGMASVSLNRQTVQDFTPAVASGKCDFTSSWTQSIHINFRLEELISSSLPTVSESDSHSIYIKHRSWVLCGAREDQVV